MKRLFIAIDLPGEIQALIHSICYGLEGARWVRPGQIHLTMRFIGDADGILHRHICEVLDDVAQDPFDLKIKGIGHFPPRRKPKVLWLGAEPLDKLSALRNKIESALQKTSLEPEHRKFSPHITIARFKDSPPIKKVAGFMALHSLFKSPAFKVDSFHLYSSILSPKGAIHQIEHTYSLDTTP